jgi:hypothetical protein
VRLRKKVLLIIAITGALLTAIHTVLAIDEGWSNTGGASARNLSISGDVRQPTLAIADSGEVAVAWAGIGDEDIPGNQKGIFFAVGEGSSTPLTLTEEMDAWAPNAVYDGSRLRIAWVQGDYSSGPMGTLYQEDVGSGNPARILMAPVYGYTAPQMVIGENGYHFIMASAETPGTFSQADIYYIHRPVGSDTWLSPTKIITHAQASAPYSGGIWYPYGALSADSQTLHLVWEQTINQARSIWYTSGAWTATQTFEWDTPIRLSLVGQAAVRPKVAVDDQGHVHIAWVEQDVVSLEPLITMQYINYRRWEQGNWYPSLDQDAIRLDKTPVQVNTYRPTWSTISMAAAENKICVAWHGYRGAPGASGNEEIFMNCSNDRGKTWSDIVTNISETIARLSLFPVMGIDQDADLHIAWEEHQGGSNYRNNYDIFYRNGPIPPVVKLVYLPLVLRTS